MKKMVLLSALLMVAAFAGIASADTLPPTLPHNLHHFDTSGPGGAEPCWFLGFTPMPDPAGDNQPADQRDPMLTVEIFVLDPNGNNLGPLKSTETVNTPEPGTLALMGTGMLGLSGL